MTTKQETEPHIVDEIMLHRSRCYPDLLAACRAIRARVVGEFDNPDLLVFGALGEMQDDVLRLANAAIRRAEWGA